MGIDIHGPHIEELDGGHWYSVATMDTGRNTALFGLMAGVRAGHALVEPRGYPADLEQWERHCPLGYTPGECHTPSWLTFGEVLDVRRALYRELKREGVRKAGRWSMDLETIIAVMASRGADTRIVFDFDG
jgi:hypothetical protein